jgi:hypothetical protein
MSRAETTYASDRAATEIGPTDLYLHYILHLLVCSLLNGNL